MTREAAHTARLAYLYNDSHSTEQRIRRFAEILVDDFDPLLHAVEERRVTWLGQRNRGYVQHNATGGTIEPPEPLRTLTVQIPGGDFAARLVVEQQIREQLAASPNPPLAFAALDQHPRTSDAQR